MLQVFLGAQERRRGAGVVCGRGGGEYGAPGKDHDACASPTRSPASRSSAPPATATTCRSACTSPKPLTLSSRATSSTSAPSAPFAARLWELKGTESIDVLDALGSNIRLNSRGVQVMRMQPRTKDNVNEEWISDKTSYSYDGLRTQRLATPLIKSGDRFVPATWEDALDAIKTGLASSRVCKGEEAVDYRRQRGRRARFITPEWNGFSVLQRVPRLARRSLRPRAPPHLASIYPQQRREIHIHPQRRRHPRTHDPTGRVRGVPNTTATRAQRTPRKARRESTRRGAPPPGAAREDWKVLRALSEVLGVALPYADTLDVRDRMWEVTPSLVRYDLAEGVSSDVAFLGLAASAASPSMGEKIGKAVFKKPISNFYQTDVVSRASKTIAECTRAFVLGRDHGFSEVEAEGAKAQAFA
ncbi:hypothetical protein C0992_009553 [Termitomyces sp. T32_za158]|nr:hypothetical protein C0992_009553 [Termitomyces sp. T32_za158]